MAQPLFDQHPLEQYFRNTGETAEPMPGASPDFAAIEEGDSEYDVDFSLQEDIQLPELLVWAIQIANDLLRTSSCSSRENGFEERFKYDIISSSLLSSSLAAPATTPRPSLTPEFPGKLDGGRGLVGDEHFPSESKSDFLSRDSTSSAPSNLSGPEWPVGLLSIAVVLLSTGFTFLAVVFFAAALYMRYVMQADHSASDSLAQTLHALNELISAGNIWDSAVNQAIVLIENEERSIFYGPTSPQAPSSALRIALQSSLFTTQTQCDNVRQLLSALTCPTSLSQLTEMYAPTSPIRPPIALGEPGSSPSSTMRPFSHPSATPWRQRTSPTRSDANKRATWNGSYAALAGAGSPTAHLLSNRKKQNRRSNVMSMFPPVSPRTGAFSSFSAPVTPEPISPAEGGGGQLAGVLEEEGDDAAEELEDKNYFGAAALDLQRKRRSVALEALGLPPPSYTPPKSPTRGGGRPLSLLAPTISSASRLTSVHTTRHPLSLSGLHLALQGALAAKRYSCSHLLALRFTEDEDEAYWEDVRSVMALLSSTFADASARLVDALDDAEKRRKKDEHPTPPRGNTPTPGGKEHARGHERKNSPLRNDYTPRASLSLMDLVSFAPMPSSMARLATHMEAISSALGDAREHIDECVGALRDPASRRASLDGSTAADVQAHPAFQAYDRLRKELGFALRECERGRERLLDILSPRPLTDAAAADDDDVSPHTPGLKHDHDSESEVSEKGPASPHAGLGLTLSYGREDHDLDDATAHLLLTASSQHLPPPGADQVFEADSGSAAAFARPRSKLPREERIKLAKARRASGRLFSTGSSSAVGGVSPHFEVPAGPRERWGPGGEVVQELKDVIWKVGEKKRKMSQQVQIPVPVPRAQDLELALEPGSEKAGRSALAALPVPERESSISIEVVEGSPVADMGERAYPPEPESETEASEFEVEAESELAYLDSPELPPSLSLPAPHTDSCLVLESGSDADDILWTASQPTPAHAASAPIPALVLEGEGRLDIMS